MLIALRIFFHPLILGVVLLSVAINGGRIAMAQDSDLSGPCANSPDDQALRNCRAGDLERATGELNAVSRELMLSLSEGLDGNAEALETAQADWDRFMRSECRLINFESLSGTAGDIYEMTCFASMTRARIKSLRDMLESP